MKTMKVKQKHRWTMFGAILGVMLLGLGIWATTPEQTYAEDAPGTPSGALDAIEVEYGTLRQKAMTNELTPEEEKREAWLGGQLMQRILDASLGSFNLEGVVVDEQGKLLHDVSLLISKEKMTGVERRKEDDEERVINGKFSIIARGYNAVRLYVNKEGYYEERVYFSNLVPNDDQKLGKPVVDQRDIRIILEKRGNITRLTEEDFKLIYRRQEDGTASGRVADLDRKKWALPPDDRSLYSIPVTNLLDPEVIPPMCVYMLPKVHEDGRILTETKELEKWKPYNHTETYPKELRIVTNDPEGGFIIYDRQPDKNAYWTMKLAPETGYSQEIVLDADHLFQRSGYVASGAEKHIFFYCKLNGLYGKGRFESIRLPEGDYALELDTEFRMQTDGSRNLDTGRR